MKQNIKILISKNATNDGVWVSFPISQREFDRLTRKEELQPNEFDIPQVICNSYNLSQLLMNRARPPSFLSKLNYLGSLFSGFETKQRTEFGFFSDFLFDQSNPLEDYINLAINIKNGEAVYSNLTVHVPPEFKLQIKRRNKKQDK